MGQKLSRERHGKDEIDINLVDFTKKEFNLDKKTTSFWIYCLLTLEN